MQTLKSRLLADPRHYQIAVLASLLLYGVIALDFEVPPLRIVAILVSLVVACFGAVEY